MEDTFEPKSLNIKNLFGSPDSLFQVPIYQRPYSWEDEQVEQLWEDLYEAYKNPEDNPNYFLGPIITIFNKEGYQDIVDGQQRITTLMILFCVIRDFYPNINQDTGIAKNPDVIEIKRIKGFISDEDDRKRLQLCNRPRLQTHSSDQNDFEQCILKDGAAIEEISLKTDKESVKCKFKQTAEIFKEELKEIGEEEAGKFVNYIGNNVKFIKIACNNQSFAIKLFQILNDRGKSLENSDLIKSDLIAKLSSDKWKQFRSDWDNVKSIINDLNRDKGIKGIDDMFTLYIYYHLGANPKKSNYEEMRSISKNTDSNQIINEFKNFCCLYKDELSNSSDKMIHCFRYLRWEMYWRAILITALKEEEFSEYQDLVFELRRYYYLNWIAGKNINTIKQISFSLIKSIKAKKPLSFIKEKLEEKLKADNILQLALNNLKSDVDGERWIKPVLMMMEYHQTDGEEADFKEVSGGRKTPQLEHILPVEYKQTQVWEHISETVAENYLHSIGNLTLLGGRKNIGAGNRSFKDKLKVYAGQKGDKGITSFRITQKIAQDAIARSIKQWDEEAMQDRWNWFLSKLDELLRIDTSSIRISEQNKIEHIKGRTLYQHYETEEVLKQDRKEESGKFTNQLSNTTNFYTKKAEDSFYFFTELKTELETKDEMSGLKVSDPLIKDRNCIVINLNPIGYKKGYKNEIRAYRVGKSSPHELGVYYGFKDEDKEDFEDLKKRIMPLLEKNGFKGGKMDYPDLAWSFGFYNFKENGGTEKEDKQWILDRIVDLVKALNKVKLQFV